MSANNNESIDFGKLILIGALAFGVYYFVTQSSNFPSPTPNPDPSPIVSNDFPEPNKVLKNLLPNFGNKISGRRALDLAYLYKNMSGEVLHNSNVTTLNQVIEKHKEVGLAVERNNGYDFKTGLGNDLNNFILSDLVCGKVQNSLSTEDKIKISDGLSAVAWGFFQSAGEEGVRELHEAFYNCDEDGCPLDEQEYLEYIQNISNAASFEEQEEPIVDLDGKLLLMQAEGEANQVRGPPIDESLTHGLLINMEDITKFNSTIPQFQQFGYDGSGKGKTVLLYESTLKYDPLAFTERQTTGDCTSHGTRNAVDISRSYEIDKLGENESFVARGATEAIYGYRGHADQGMSVDRAMRFISETGGLAIRKNYAEAGIDLSKYDPKDAIQWGRSGGTPERLLNVIKANQAENIALISSVEEARDALSNGFALVSGSMHSFPSKRDQYGRIKRDGRKWAHCICFGAVSTESDLTNGASNSQDPYFLYINSWGPNWIAGPKGRYQIPDGAGWIDDDDMSFIIKQQQTYAVSDIRGFKAEKIKSFGFEWLD